MSVSRRAVIDVGTNSVKLLVGDVLDHDVRPVFERSHQTRLGEGLYANGTLQPGGIARTAAAVAEFAASARSLQAERISVIGTSAAREARNVSALADAILKSAGVPLNVISGDEEAELAFVGVSCATEYAHAPLLIMEVGGGSTQFIVGRHRRPQLIKSLAVGTVRLLESASYTDPPQREELMRCRRWVTSQLKINIGEAIAKARVGEALNQTGDGAMHLIGTGGTATILARMKGQMTDFNRVAIEQIRINSEWLRSEVDRLWQMPLADRKTIVGLPPNRADLILFGAVIYEAGMSQLGFDELRITTRGLRFGALLG
jgi:exopolyphosphatase/guanosine-5'-triphosphate,3'-diphosphate pyrophosphatase